MAQVGAGAAATVTRPLTTVRGAQPTGGVAEASMRPERCDCGRFPTCASVTLFGGQSSSASVRMCGICAQGVKGFFESKALTDLGWSLTVRWDDR